jgi:hypothetical protein
MYPAVAIAPWQEIILGYLASLFACTLPGCCGLASIVVDLVQMLIALGAFVPARPLIPPAAPRL